MLVGAVVVGAVRDRGAQAVGAGPGAHEHVGAGLVLEYGEDGWYGVSSVNLAGSSSARSP